MKYSTVTVEQLTVLQQGLDLLGHVSNDLLPTTLYLYGLLNPDSPALANVTEAVWEDSYAGETRSEELHIQTAAVSIRLSGDILRVLLGSGLKSDDDEFVYMLNGEIHSSSFSYAPTKPTLVVSQFTKIALGDDSYWLKDFFQAEAAQQEQQHPSVVERTEQAVQDHGGSAAPLHQKHPHQSSRKGWTSEQIAAIIEDMLGGAK